MVLHSMQSINSALMHVALCKWSPCKSESAALRSHALISLRVHTLWELQCGRRLNACLKWVQKTSFRNMRAGIRRHPESTPAVSTGCTISIFLSLPVPPLSFLLLLELLLVAYRTYYYSCASIVPQMCFCWP